MNQDFDPTRRETKFLGIPGTGHDKTDDWVKGGKDEVKKIFNKAKRDFEHDIEELAGDVEAKAKKVFNKAGREIRHGLHEAGEEIEDGIKKAAGEAEDAIKDAFYALAAQAVHIAVNDLVDAIQAKLFTGPIFVKLWWFRFYIDPNTKIDALQRAASASHPPKGKQNEGLRMPLP